MTTTQFYFGRLHFTSQLPLDHDFGSEFNRQERIEEALWNYASSEEPVYYEGEGDDTLWVFSSVERDEGRICGKFGRVYTKEQTKFDFDMWDFVEETSSGNQAVYSYFVVFPAKNLIAFNQRRQIGYRQFQDAFAKGYNRHVGRKGALSMRLLKSTADVQKIISNHVITRVAFDLVPTNPSSNPDMKALDDHIQGMDADEVTISAKSNVEADTEDSPTAEADGGVNMDEDLMRAAVSMSAAGYGEFKMDFFNEERSDTYNSRDRPAGKEVEQVNTVGQLKQIAPKIRDRALELLNNE
jgi:hypothetical protein